MQATGKGSTAVFIVEAGDYAGGLAVFGFLFEVLALVALVFAFADGDLKLDMGAFPVGAQDGEGASRDLDETEHVRLELAADE